MKFEKTVSFLVVCIILFSFVAASSGIFMNAGPGNYQFVSLHGEKVTIYGKGLYQFESAKLGPQARAQDVVTILIGIPLLIISLYYSRKGSLKGRLLLAGTLSYFLYTYMQFTSIQYNQMFLIYIILMAVSLYAFILVMMSFDMKALGSSFNDKIPVKFIAGFEIFTALGLSMRWLSDLIPSIINNTFPAELQHYTSIPVYSMDLGLVVPTFLVAAILLLKKKPFGYLLSAVMIFKGVTMWAALTAMTIALVIQGIQMSFGEMVMAPIFSLITIYTLVLMLKNINENHYNEVSIFKPV